ncbi:MAG: hypothetical protein A4E34_00756 [Methanoregula sp. PtaU1.Bin006]|nr:MAG: hypothetical protein A4E33_01459 [Methanoregula sp. PtaB.Bin085]OPY35481.1 MAG: hypothetical protein A4E34_00756 [Methanoregula sp. PtaU1.Bin006]
MIFRAGGNAPEKHSGHPDFCDVFSEEIWVFYVRLFPEFFFGKTDGRKNSRVFPGYLRLLNACPRPVYRQGGPPGAPLRECSSCLRPDLFRSDRSEDPEDGRTGGSSIVPDPAGSADLSRVGNPSRVSGGILSQSGIPGRGTLFRVLYGLRLPKGRRQDPARGRGCQRPEKILIKKPFFG